jgi:hypothetical protein
MPVRAFRRALLLLALGTTAACGGGKKIIVVNGIEVYEKHWNQVLTDLGPRASYDLNCPREQLELTLFKRTGRVPTEVGVAGCGTRAMYIKQTARVPGGMAPIISDTWILNSDSRAAASAPPPTGQPQGQGQTAQQPYSPTQYGQPISQ